MVIKSITPDQGLGPGYALVELEQDAGVGQVELTFFDVDRQQYLWPSSNDRASWRKETYYFRALRADSTRPVFRLGPDACNYLEPGSLVEISSKDGFINREGHIWEGVPILSQESEVLPVDLPQTSKRKPVVIVNPPRPRLDGPEAEANRRRQQEEERRRKELEADAAAQAKREADEQDRRHAEQAAAQRASEDKAKLAAGKKAQDELEAKVRAATVAQAKREADELERRRAEQAAAAQRASEEKAKLAKPEKSPDGPSASPLAKLAAALVLLVLLGGIFAIGWTVSSPQLHTPETTKVAQLPEPSVPVLPFIIEKDGPLKITSNKQFLVFRGPQGGPFDPQEIKIVLSVDGDGTSWSVDTDDTSSIRVSPSQGTLRQNGSVELTVSLAPSAPRLVAGRYIASAIVHTSSQSIRLLAEIDVEAKRN